MSTAERPVALMARAARLTAVSAGSVAATVGIHFLTGAGTVVSCATLLALLGVASVVTGLASASAHLTRGPVAAVSLLAAGQCLMTALLAAPSSVHGPLWTPTTAVLHLATVIALGALLLGGERVAGDGARWADAVLPRCCLAAAPLLEVIRSGLPGPSDLGALRVVSAGPQTPRGPPLVV